MFRQRIEEAGVGLTAFAVFQGLTCLASVLRALFSVVLVGITGMAAAEVADAGWMAGDLLLEALTSAANAAALFFGLRLLWMRHRTTRQFWTVYLGASILLYSYYVLSGWGCFPIVPLLANLGWLVFWLYSRRAARLYP